MHTGVRKKYGRIYFIKVILHTFPDKEAYKHISCDYVLKLEITQSNNMESFQRESDTSKNMMRFKVMNGKINKPYHQAIQKIDEPAFQTGFNTRIIAGPTQQTKYAWLGTLLVWTYNTCHNLVSRNLCTNPEVSNNQELNIMPMHQNTWGETELCHLTTDGTPH
jgi:hypothetical protein